MSLRWIEDFVNTRSIELGTDDLATPDALASWLRERGLLPRSARVTAAAQRRALTFRQGLRALIAGEGDPDLEAMARGLPLVVDVATRPPCLVAAKAGSVDGALATLLAAVAAAVADGTWSRLKVCRDPGCRWAYFDASRNRSRAWCSMETCGNRAKARAFRERGR
jgi:predicted RNA-binding Zn ribbon-like protein